MQIFKIASQFSQMNINLQPGINSLIDEFILALEKVYEIEKLFSDKECWFFYISPSTSADFCIGSSNNGWLVWKDKDGNTLDSVYRTQLE